MFTRASRHRESQPRRWQHLLPTAGRGPAPARPAAGEREMAREPLSESPAHANHTQVATLLRHATPLLHTRSSIGGLQSLYGNQAVQSILGQGPTPAEPAKSCSCGGSCATCAQSAANPTRKSEDLEGNEIEEDVFAAPQRPLSPCAESSCSLQDALEPGRSGEVIEGPHQNDATIVCDGKGDYRPDLRGWATAPCGIPDCVRVHEESHAADWRGRWPDGCKNPDGTPKPDGSQIPLGGPGYDDFLRQSECRANSAEVPCEEQLLKSSSAECQPKVQKVLDGTKKDQKRYCSSGC